MDLDKLRFWAHCGYDDISEKYQQIDSMGIGTADEIVAYLSALQDFQILVESKIERLQRALKLYFADQEDPKRAAARDMCDKILTEIDKVRDIIVRSIEGDDDVVCTESGARMVSDFLKGTIEILPLLKETVYVIPGKQ